jgi:hypothetical protein
MEEVAHFYVLREGDDHVSVCLCVYVSVFVGVC